MRNTAAVMRYRVVTAPSPSAVLNGLLVRGGAVLAGAVASAVVVLDREEHGRRAACGLGAVASLPLLDALMCLPYGVRVPAVDLGDRVAEELRSAPSGCVEWLLGPEPVVRRVVVPAADVMAVVVESAGWADGLRRAAAFAPVAPRVVLVDRARLPADRLWEADAAGTGVWARDSDGSVREVVAPAAFVRRYVKPAGWRFRERAYGAWLRARLL
ncbi:MAG: hypothetical protein JWP11_133 [Frankiales bacterium]|nr:hypothetical protein [Frankiales bacterium]